MAEAARVLDFEGYYNYGSAAPVRESFPDSAPGPFETPGLQERIRQRELARAEAAGQDLPMVSLFAVFGFVIVGILMIFVVLAQISYNEAAADTLRLNTQLLELAEQQRALTIAFESVICMKEVEQYARDVLGMSRPENYQTAVVLNTVSDRAEVLSVGEVGSLRGFGSFISSLLEHFKR